MTHHSSDEVHRQYVDAMGQDLGDVYFKLWTECSLVHWKWAEYVELYGTSEQRIGLLNNAAGSFFRLIQNSLWDDVLLHIARMTDATQSMRKDNLTVMRLPMLVDAVLAPQLGQLLDHCRETCAFARDWRMRYLAHRDLALALGRQGAKPLTPASRKAVNEALKALAEVLNTVELHYRNAKVTYEVPVHRGAESLLYVLRDGLRVEAQRKERIRCGALTVEDLKSEPPV